MRRAPIPRDRPTRTTERAKDHSWLTPTRDYRLHASEETSAGGSRHHSFAERLAHPAEAFNVIYRISHGLDLGLGTFSLKHATATATPMRTGMAIALPTSIGISWGRSLTEKIASRET